MKVLHVTEALGGGVLSAMQILLREQAAAGAEIGLIHTRRPETPDEAWLNENVAAHLRKSVVDVSGFSAIPGLVGEVLRQTRKPGWDVVHAHSSLAGVACRVIPQPARTLFAYSPHAYAFNRYDVSAFTRLAIRLTEQSLANRGAIIAVSNSEAKQARALGARRVGTLLNRIDAPSSRMGAQGTDSKRVVAVGRLCPQKAPERFSRLAESLGESAECVWVGDGDRKLVNERHVHITGWLDRQDAAQILRDARVFVLLSRWEGLPVSLLEAQALGIPSVVTNIPGNSDLVVDGVNGFLVSSLDDTIRWTRELLNDEGRWAVMSERAVTLSGQYCDIERVGSESIGLYETLMS